MRFIIPIVIILTLASCSNKAKLIETCADEDFLIAEDRRWVKFDMTENEKIYQRERRNFKINVEDGKLSLQEKLRFNQFNETTGLYEGYYGQCEDRFNHNPETFKQKYQ